MVKTRALIQSRIDGGKVVEFQDRQRSLSCSGSSIKRRDIGAKMTKLRETSSNKTQPLQGLKESNFIGSKSKLGNPSVRRNSRGSCGSREALGSTPVSRHRSLSIQSYFKKEKNKRSNGGLEKALSQGLCDLTPGGVLPKLSDGAADGLSSSQAMDSGSATPMVEKA